MKLKDKIKWRLRAYIDFIKNINKIKKLYSSLDKESKKEFFLMVVYFLLKTIRPSFLFNWFSKFLRKEAKFYNPKEKYLFFENYIFKFKNPQIRSPSKNFVQELSSMIEEIFEIKIYENREVKIEPGDVVLDCGAHIGVFSIFAAQKAKIVYAFEPSKDEVLSLEENKKLNNCHNIEIIPRAVLDITKKAKLVLSGVYSHFVIDNDNNLISKDNKDKAVIDIETISIDDFVKEKKLTEIDFIKMDIEGSEEKAVYGAKETLKKFQPKLAICLYHKVDDFYKIPLLIKELNSSYKIKLKNKRGTLIAYAI
jgi:FkbM family methyltransferase